MMTLRQRCQHWWSAIQQWIAGPGRLLPGERSQTSIGETGATSSAKPASALLTQLASHPHRRSDTRNRCSTTVSARAWPREQRVIDLLTYHAARHACGVTPEQMQLRLTNIRARVTDR